MQARRAARELALILFSQFDKKIMQYNLSDFEEIILKTVRTLTNNASEELKLTLGAIFDMKEFINSYENDHEMNISRPIGVQNIPVPLPMTSDMTGRLDELLEIAEKALAALEIAEFATLESQDEVREYVLKIAQTFKDNSQVIDEEIQKFSKGWNFDRLIKMDKDVLRIAIAELLYIKETPMKVVVDEALELAKKYSTEDSASFINGILAKVILENGIKK